MRIKTDESKYPRDQTAVKMGVGNRINFICGDFFKMPFAENVFDLVWNDGVIEHFDEPHKVVTRMAEVTKPGGKVIVSVPAKWTTHTWITRPLARWRGRYPFDKWGRERSYTAKELSKIMIASGLSGIESLNCHIYQGLVPGFLTARLRRPGLAPFIPALFNGFDWIEEKIPLLKNLGFISAAAGLKTQE